jgi:hypothetical protein
LEAGFTEAPHDGQAVARGLPHASQNRPSGSFSVLQLLQRIGGFLRLSPQRSAPIKRSVADRSPRDLGEYRA